MLILPVISETQGTEEFVRLLSTDFDVLNCRCDTESLNSFNYSEKLKVRKLLIMTINELKYMN